MKYLLIVVSISFYTLTFTQNYWQQEVNYKISVKLNDKENTISAFEEFEYINNSPNELEFIYVHLWPNAYKNGKTALGKQLYKGKNKSLVFGNDSIKGWIDSLNFKINDKEVRWELDKEHIDICKIHLNSPLKSGEKMRVSTPFKVKIPSGEISRLGHVGQSYQITQWYPKPAVYDKNGWNQIPYLNQGEFYSEYGSFDVSITLPKNYVLAATGDLQTKSEINFLNSLAKQTEENFRDKKYSGNKDEKKNEFPISSTEFKTVRFTQTKVHDFAWFADKRYDVLKGEVELPHSKRKISTWTMFTPQNALKWENSIEYINDGTYYYSLWNGDYPYNNVTAVDGTISAGGGMEYPNVTVIGNTSSKTELEIVIVHEVGHNWFYGILGSNERVHGWMDEGLNTLNEMRYVETKYPNNKQLSDMVSGSKFHFENLNHYDMGDLGYRTISILGEDQPLETHSADFTSMNYGLIMYQKTGLIFHYLKDYLGEKDFDKAMQSYFDNWKFKHPQPEDMRIALQNSSGKNLDWMFEDLIKTTNHIDYKIKSVKSKNNETSIKIKNSGQVNGPIPITVYSLGKPETIWSEPSDKRSSEIIFPYTIDSAQIDPNRQIPEIDRTNNTWNKSWLFNRSEPLKFEFFIGDNETKKSNNFWLPVIMGNSQDKLMLGLIFHNYNVPFNKFQYLIAPAYSFGRKNVSGFSEMSLTSLPKRNFKLIRTGFSLKSFKNETNFRGNESYYASAAPYVFLKIGNRKNETPFSQSLLVQSLYRYDQIGAEKLEQVGGIAKFNWNYYKSDFQVKTELRGDYINNINNSNEMTRLMAEVTFKYKYLKNKKNSWMELRLFGGNIVKRTLNSNSGTTFPYYTNSEFNGYTLSLNGMSGAQDIFTEDFYFSRTNSNFGSNQRAENMGNFKSNGNFGTTTKFLATGNYYVQLPINPNVFGLFADVGMFHNGTKIENVVNTGVAFKLSNVFGLYFPIWMSKNLNDSFSKQYLEKVRFSLKLTWTNQNLKLSSLF